MTSTSTMASPAAAPDGRGGDSSDATPIAELHRVLALQRAACLADPYPSEGERREHLQALAGAVLGHREQIRAAMREDFAATPDLFTDLVEVLGVAGRAGHALASLEQWMAEEPRDVDPQVYGTARAAVRHQPKGVVGIITPWNFPFDLSLGPLVEVLAAGNRAVLKPSEHTPACSALLAQIVAETFEEDRVAVAVGGLALAVEFPSLRWDHILYTGGPEVGRAVLRAAAENLTPVTLELGGKCPALLAPDSVDAASVRSVVATKLVKNGQMCISVDHALVPRARLADFVAHARHYVDTEMPGFATSADSTGMITERHRERVTELVEEARAAGAEVVTLGGEGDPLTRRLPLTLVVDPPEGLRLMHEEVFGPVLPVLAYDDLDDAVARVNAGERPLGLYVYAGDADVAESVLRRTTSGGACVGTSAVQGTLPSLGFGGVGGSGYGRHHGHDGFREFSNARGVVVRGEGDVIDAFLPPYGPLAQAVVDGAFAAAAAPSAAEPSAPDGGIPVPGAV